jgi:hypothetical protein
LGSSRPQRLASSSESGVVTPVPQLPQFEATASAGGLIVDHRTLLMMKDPEPQLPQANPLPSITWRTHSALSPETCTPADYSTGTALGRPTRRHRCSSSPRHGPQRPRNLPARGTRYRVPTPWSPTPAGSTPKAPMRRSPTSEVPAKRTPGQTRRQVPPTQMPMRIRARTHPRRGLPTACPDRSPSWSFLLGRPRALPGRRPHGLLPW